MLQTLVVGETADSVELRGNVVIEVVTRSYRSVRGRSVCAALLDELAFWRDDSSANPDSDVLNAIRASSPYSRRGVLWDMHQRFYAKNDAANLFWRAPTTVMNPTVTKDFLGQRVRA